jgi:hypothetical protein
MTGGVHMSARRGVSGGTGSGPAGMGRGLASAAGLVSFPGAQNDFYFFSPFSFSGNFGFECCKCSTIQI